MKDNLDQSSRPAWQDRSRLSPLFAIASKNAELERRLGMVEADLGHVRAQYSEAAKAVEKQTRYLQVLERLNADMPSTPSRLSATYILGRARLVSDTLMNLWKNRGRAREGASPSAGPATGLGSGTRFYRHTEHGLSPLSPRPGWQCFTMSAEKVTHLAFNLCGLERSEIEKCVAEVASLQARRRDFVPLFLTNGDDLKVFTQYGYSYERLPGFRDLAAFHDEGSIRDIVDQRVAFVVTKWRISEIVNLGQPSFTMQTSIVDLNDLLPPVDLHNSGILTDAAHQNT